jgi:hypothetical protein
MKLKLTIATVLSVALGAAALGSASAGEAGAKPGLMPGKWHGTGVITGSITDAAATTTFSGKVGFRLTVLKNFAVKGTGSWVKTMKGRGDVSSTMTGIGYMFFGGTARDIRYAYTETVEGTVTANGIASPVSFQRGDEKLLASQLVITRARKCTATGFIPTGEGMKITWTAKRLGACSE